MTNQEIFDKVCLHLVTQNRQSSDKNGRFCMYRGEDGTKCAVGCLIPDEIYEEHFERKVVELLPSKIFYYIGIDSKSKQLLKSLQLVHDNFKPMEWKQLLRGVAKNYELIEPECIKE